MLVTLPVFPAVANAQDKNLFIAADLIDNNVRIEAMHPNWAFACFTGPVCLRELSDEFHCLFKSCQI